MAARALIAIVTTYYRPVHGGVEASAEQVARYLARQGRTVRVVTKRTSAAHAVRETIDGVDVLRTPPVGERRAAGKWFAVPFVLAALWRARDDIRVICCVDYRGVGLAALAIRAVTGAPVVFETSTDGTISGKAIRRGIARLGIAENGVLARFVTWPVRAVYRQADMFICVSRAIERELVECGVAAERVVYMPHPVDTIRFAPVARDQRLAVRRRLGLPEDRTIAIFLGRLSREKGIRDLLEAWAGLESRDALLVFVGPDMPDHPWNEGPWARAFVEARGIAASVRFAGSVAHEDVALWLQAADFAVQPSHFEAFGIAAMEAMASGLPVVATNVGGFQDYIENGVNGWRVPPRDPTALREVIRIVLDDRKARERAGVLARQTALRFDEASILADFTRVLDRLARE